MGHCEHPGWCSERVSAGLRAQGRPCEWAGNRGCDLRSANMKRRMIRFVSLWAIVLSTSLNVQAQFAGGTGEPNDPYLIATAEQFLAVDSAAP